MNDNGKLALVTTAAAMLLMLRGQSWTSVTARLAPEWGTLCVCQRHAIARFGSALERSVSHRDTSGRAPARRS